MIFHTDEYLTAHFSYSIGDLTNLDWFGVYPPKGEWVCQFPILYFFFQKLFFNIFGVGTVSMRLSALPYVLIVFISLFLISKHLYNERVALSTITLLSLFSPDLYLTRWALHFTSSTALFLVATYFFILCLKFGKKIHFGLLGFFLGLCYMTYYSSYIAVPLLSLYLFILIIKGQINAPSLKNFLLPLVIFLYTMGPLFIYAAKVDNFFTQRTAQVKLINGLWSPYQNIEINPKSVLEILEKQNTLSIKSLYTDGIGGHGGYVFGNLALFDKLTFFFFLLSSIYFLYKIIKDKDAKSVFILATIVISFVTGMVLTFPPPAFHRFSIAFPFITLLIAVTINNLYSYIKQKKGKLAFLVLILCITAIMISNVLHFRKILISEQPDNPDYPIIEYYLDKQGEKMVYIAAFNSYGFGRFLFIRSGGTINSLTKSLDELLKVIPKNRVSTLVILYPNEEMYQKVVTSFPNTKKIGQYRWHLVLSVN